MVKISGRIEVDLGELTPSVTKNGRERGRRPGKIIIRKDETGSRTQKGSEKRGCKVDSAVGKKEF